MSFTNDLRDMLRLQIGAGKSYPNKKRMADALNVDPSQLNRFLDGERGLAAETIDRILEGLGAHIVLSGPGAANGETGQEGVGCSSQRPVCFICAQATGAAPLGTSRPPDSEDYFAVPLASESVAAVPGRIPEEAVRGWVLVWRHHESVRFRTDLVAVEVGRGDMSMAPTLHPGDIVLVDRAEHTPDPAGKIMLVTGPDAGCAVKRVSTQPVEGDLEIIFYSDNSREFPPTVHRLRRDYGGELARAIVGRVIWAWSDMTRK